ncbi:MAG: hypothetical protein QOH89_3657 [Pseudonocardiales bacterium]|nr:hypothetical protein [Pseudonocardiales bacterium]
MAVHRILGAVLALAVATTIAACSSSAAPGGGSSTPTGPPTEVHPPGDIPDNQAFVPYSGAGYRVVVPEGWSRANQGGAVQFSDKYNSITITARATGQAPTVAGARSELPAIRSSTKSFTAGRIATVQRSAGTAVLVTYQDLSPVNPVTGKVTRRAVERYEFWRSGREVVLTLAAPVGSDNVDPWRKVTDGFAWTR